ncbi:hypothetical protein SNOG_08734 [Parastagonospora nodorum SN15]|uniref:Uncharacterized protein n=1 Tax=Phaeosphaeria nodorum (strain SN15 / ATCC MYA-4574 / FGSC 10173) TaxID=321614 RepID=Q0UHN0_PHANO|nr:hypothetical protein SNOG_08734 [Parastagonospora nodorum SN15]EAT83902.1 hypothetical protein SNOG_08734 [Parastagonospora nodorum SN15]
MFQLTRLCGAYRRAMLQAGFPAAERRDGALGAEIKVRRLEVWQTTCSIAGVARLKTGEYPLQPTRRMMFDYSFIRYKMGTSTFLSMYSGSSLAQAQAPWPIRCQSIQDNSAPYCTLATFAESLQSSLAI